ncbi:uncharacterized protein G2W53_028952 [Senna tora]|uniref:Uncharacterized protein n=1 Tax=Senna tora TaxID=362788 RepID=A0A834WBA8_9FABA|nr:uncharacterized protein G2W53_028952 [Senna tora]
MADGQKSERENRDEDRENGKKL